MVLHFAVAGILPPSTCLPVTPAGIRIYPPGSIGSVIAPFNAEQVCSNRSLSGWSDVSDVYSPSVFSV
jgi:hypothetical protein